MHRQFLFVLLTIAILASCTEKGSQPDTTPVMPQPAPKVSQPAAPEPKQEKPEEPKRVWRTVERVIDGNTIELDGGEKVRLIGVNTPEIVDERKSAENFGVKAAEFTRKMVEGKQVWLEYDQMRKDKYGRTLAYVDYVVGKHTLWADGGQEVEGFTTSVLNEEIIRQGYGHAYTEYPFKYMEKYRELEREAREAKRGLWAPKKEEPIPPPAVVTPERMMPREAIETLPEENPQAESKSATVYITKTGKKYHRGSCSYLKKSKIPILLEDAKKQGYTPCSRCKPPE